MIANQFARPNLCASCGTKCDLSTGAPEFCQRCGSPVGLASFDPFRARASATMVAVNSRAKAIVRFGILGIGLIGLATGSLLFYEGWLTASALDPVQVWISRISSPLLITQGFFYSWLPFRRPTAAKVIRFPKRFENGTSSATK